MTKSLTCEVYYVSHLLCECRVKLPLKLELFFIVLNGVCFSCESFESNLNVRLTKPNIMFSRTQYLAADTRVL